MRHIIAFTLYVLCLFVGVIAQIVIHGVILWGRLGWFATTMIIGYLIMELFWRIKRRRASRT